MKVIDHKDAINRRLYNNQSFVETAIYRVSSLNRTVLGQHLYLFGVAWTFEVEIRFRSSNLAHFLNKARASYPLKSVNADK
ncbi:hypothetical protein ACEYW6_14630 [Nostoc sp. UIC 10607]|uniref:hypothetical protein n=1 Tax=Nostoc sp. UIC 10607 TaxID=3045935 RepID=UPI0039A27042